jgi:predicted DNA-binding protein (MmcQ/YjbR family)
MTHKTLEAYILTLPGAFLDYPFGPGVAVYKVNVKGKDKMFGIISEDEVPLRISLKCDPEYAEQLRAEHDYITPGYHLNKKHWNTIEFNEKTDEKLALSLVVHSFELIVG